MTRATKPTTAAKKSAPSKKSAPAKKSTPSKKSAPAKKSTPSKKSTPAKKSVPAKKSLSLVARVRRTRGLPMRERLEVAMHRELKHAGPVCHPCRMNASRLASLAGAPPVVAV